MGELLRREDLSTYLRDVERRVLALETSRRPSQTFVDVVPVEAVSTFEDDYVDLFRIRVDTVNAPVLTVRLAASGAGVTQGSWRLKAGTGIDMITSAEIAFAGAAANYTATLTFLEGMVGVSSFSVEVQAKRTSGASFVSLFYPTMARLDYGSQTIDVGS